MKFYRLIIALSFFQLACFSCKSDEEKLQDNVNKSLARFKENQRTLDGLVREEIEIFKADGYPRGLKEVEDFKQSKREELQNIGVRTIWTREVGGCTEVEIGTNWSDISIGSTRLTWTSCHPKESGTAFYNHWGNDVEIRKITDNWYLWLD